MFGWLIKKLVASGMVPRISETEQTALEAGTVWLDGEFFSGRPNFTRMLAEPYPRLSVREQQFLDGPCSELCALVDAHEIMRTRVIPDAIWHALREKGFFGLTIPQKYGGMEFSALACSAIFGKVASRSLAVSALTLIPNSVGPAELLLHYGTDAQRDHYLPRLARGEEVPCFALTEPEAGSDAASIQSSGVVFRNPEGALQIRLQWRKRYITLAPVATLIGLAFKLHDPDNLLGRGTNPGITCALVPASLPGVSIGRRHDPMGIPLPNGPTEGHDVIIGADQIIGGPAYAGRGWKMLMESLGAGRSISLPGQSSGGARYVARVVGAYAATRQQFGMPIARFEGIEEPLARIAGLSYLMDASRVLTAGNVDQGGKPSVISAIVKYQQTELTRQIVNDGMDVLGGAGLSRGPNNVLAEGYISAPIAITVEGANILTRTLIIFGQGAIRCHPYALRELKALAAGDGGALVKSLGGHMAFLTRNLFRLGLGDMTRGWLNSAPPSRAVSRWFKKLAWASTRFAVLTDLAMITMGSKLKQRGKLSGRFADALSWMYLGYAVLHRYEHEGRRREDLPLVHWGMHYSLSRVQAALEGIAENFEVPGVGAAMKVGAFWMRLNRLCAPPSDGLGASVARLIGRPGPQRDRLTENIYLPEDPTVGVGRLENAMRLQEQVRPLLTRLRKAKLPRGGPQSMLEAAVAQGVLTADEAIEVRKAEAARQQAMTVDSFAAEEYFLATAPSFTTSTR